MGDLGVVLDEHEHSVRRRRRDVTGLLGAAATSTDVNTQVKLFFVLLHY
jgi:hypothetical protein